MKVIHNLLLLAGAFQLTTVAEANEAAILRAQAVVCSEISCFVLSKNEEPIKVVRTILPDTTQFYWYGHLLLTKSVNVDTNVQDCGWGGSAAGKIDMAV